MSISRGEQELLDKLGSYWKEGAAARDDAAVDWKRHVDLGQRGKMWPDRRPSYKVDAVMNFIGPIVEKKTALLTDGRPTMQVLSRKPVVMGQDDDLGEVAKVLTSTIMGILDEGMFEDKLTELVFYEQYFGMAYTNVPWVKSLNFGKGDIDTVIVDPRMCVFDPFVRRTYALNTGEYFAIEGVCPTEELRDTYSKRADDIKADFSEQATEKSDSLYVKIRKILGKSTEGRTRVSTIPRSIKREYWIKDRKKEKDEKGKMVRVYPNWRVIRVAGGCIVSDSVNPYWDGDLPYDAMSWDFNVDDAYGLNEIMKHEMPQVMFNKILAGVVENIIAMGNGIWMGEKTALSPDEWNKLNNAPGQLVKYRPGTKIDRKDPPSMPSYIMRVLEMLPQAMEKISTITEVMEGRKPGQVTSGNAIDSLQTAAQTAIRLKARQLESLEKKIGQKLISRIFEYFSEDRVFHLWGGGEGYEQFIYLRKNILESLDKHNIPLKSAHEHFIFKVVPTSSLATTKWQKGLIAMQLFNSQIIDDEEVLEVIEWPNRAAVMKRVMEKKASGTMPPRQPTRQKMSKQMLGGGSEQAMQKPRGK